MPKLTGKLGDGNLRVLATAQGRGVLLQLHLLVGRLQEQSDNGARSNSGWGLRQDALEEDMSGSSRLCQTFSLYLS